MAKSSKKGYFGMSHIVSIILAIIPITSLICGLITRIQRGKIIGAILNFFIFPLFWLVDLITIIVKNEVTFLA
ncbi:MAG: hypothetical protein II896_00920 [Clostridia bacterium]|nr:hypothetical protein [Clostridia bacterium]